MTLLEFFQLNGIPVGLGLGMVFALVIVVILCVSAIGRAKKAAKTEKVVNKPVSGSPVQAVFPAPAKASGITAAIAAAINEYQKDNS